MYLSVRRWVVRASAGRSCQLVGEWSTEGHVICFVCCCCVIVCCFYGFGPSSRLGPAV